MAKRKRLGIKLIGWVIVLAAIGGGAAALSMRKPALEVTAMPVGRGYVESTVTAIASGSVMPQVDALIAAETVGKVAVIHVAEGQRVAEGDLLIELSHDDLAAHVALAEANVRAAEARVRQAQAASSIGDDIESTRVNQADAQLQQAEADYARIKSLADKKIIPQMELDRVEAALRVARENARGAVAASRETEVREQGLQGTQAALDQMKASYDLAKATFDKAFVRAPVAGVVADIIPDAGESVGPGVPMVRLVDDSDYYVEAPFDEANGSELHLDQPARVTFDTYRDRHFDGVISYIPPVVAINPDLSRTLNIKVRLNRVEDATFMTGMSADVIVLAESKHDVIFAPTQSLVREQYAFVIEDGVARRREVKLGIGNWSTMEIVEGLSEGETLITSVGLRDLVDGVPVTVVDQLAQ